MSAKSTIWTELDFAAEGKQVSYLHLPYSVTRLAYGTIAIPLTVIQNGEGPTVLLMAGNHGDEYEGQVVLCRLIRELEAGDIAGRVLIIPAANLPAAMAGARVSSLDGGNLNRLFPGDPAGGPTTQIADYIETMLAPMADYWLDLHSGGSSLDYLPFALIPLTDDPEIDAKAWAALQAFGSPLSMVFAYLQQPGLSSASARRNKVAFIGGELGGTGSINPAGVKLTYAGVVRTLAHIGVLRDLAKFDIPPAPKEIRYVELTDRDYYAFAPAPGLFEPFRVLGEEVRKGDIAGCVHFVDDPGREPMTVAFKHDGLLVCKRHMGRVERGDCVAHLATDLATPPA